MFIFTYKLEKYIQKECLQKVLLNVSDFRLKGSFKRRVPFVTDIDLTNTSKIPVGDLYQKIVDLIKKLPSDIIFLQLGCGTDNRFKLQTGSDEELLSIRDLLSEEDRLILDKVVTEHSESDDQKMEQRKLFFINEIIWDKYYKIRFLKDEIISDKKILTGGKEITLRETINANSSLVLQYSVIFGNYPIGPDVAVYYTESVDEQNIYKGAHDYYYLLSNYKKRILLSIISHQILFFEKKR